MDRSYSVWRFWLTHEKWPKIFASYCFHWVTVITVMSGHFLPKGHVSIYLSLSLLLYLVCSYVSVSAHWITSPAPSEMKLAELSADMCIYLFTAHHEIIEGLALIIWFSPSYKDTQTERRMPSVKLLERKHLLISSPAHSVL